MHWSEKNGAGKSTLMKILDGVYPVGSYGGQIFGERCRSGVSFPARCAVKGIGYVPQEIAVIESLSVAENIFVGSLAWIVSFPLSAQQFLAEAKSPASGEAGHLIAFGQLGGTCDDRPGAIDQSVALILDESTACLTNSESEICSGSSARLPRKG